MNQAAADNRKVRLRINAELTSGCFNFQQFRRERLVTARPAPFQVQLNVRPADHRQEHGVGDVQIDQQRPFDFFLHFSGQLPHALVIFAHIPDVGGRLNRAVLTDIGVRIERVSAVVWKRVVAVKPDAAFEPFPALPHHEILIRLDRHDMQSGCRTQTGIDQVFLLQPFARSEIGQSPFILERFPFRRGLILTMFFQIHHRRIHAALSHHLQGVGDAVAHDPRPEDRQERSRPVHQAAFVKGSAARRLGLHDLVGLIDEQRDEAQGDRHHHRQLVGWQTDTLERREQVLHGVGEHDRCGRERQHARRQHQEHQTHAEEDGHTDAFAGDMQKAPFP